ncbi:MAG: BON domain-containing protein [Bryobacteraceae bacterium]|jgi:hypothetical protein
MLNGNSKSAGPDGATYRRVGEDILALTAGLGAGAGLMYLCDPHRGRARRNRLVAQATGLFHRDENKLEKRAKYLLNRVEGFVAEAASALAPEEEITDEVLAERVRSRMGHVLSHPQEIQVHARHGVVTLEGKLIHAERRRLKEEVRAMPGVKRVNDRLESRSVFAPGLLMGLAAGLALFSKAGSSHTTAEHVS